MSEFEERFDGLEPWQADPYTERQRELARVRRKLAGAREDYYYWKDIASDPRTEPAMRERARSRCRTIGRRVARLAETKKALEKEMRR